MTGLLCPNNGADGTVIEVTLNTVKVRNWDNTITTIPPYLLVSDSFQNWRVCKSPVDGVEAFYQYRYEQCKILYPRNVG